MIEDEEERENEKLLKEFLEQERKNEELKKKEKEKIDMLAVRKMI